MKGPGTPEYDNDLTAIASLDLERPSSLDLVTPWAWLFDFPRFPGLAKYLSFLFCFPSPPKCINENETGNYCSYQQSTFSLGRERSYQSKNYSWSLKCTAGKLEGSSVDILCRIGTKTFTREPVVLFMCGGLYFLPSPPASPQPHTLRPLKHIYPVTCQIVSVSPLRGLLGSCFLFILPSPHVLIKLL